MLFKAGDAEALAKEVLGLLADKAGWAPMRDAARGFVERERTWVASAAGYRDVFARLAPTPK